MPPNTLQKQNMPQYSRPVLTKALSTVPATAVARSVRSHWPVLLPWVLLFLQSAVVLLLLNELQKYQGDSASEFLCSKCTTDLSCAQVDDGNINVQALVKNVHIDARIQQELPVEIPPPPIPRIFYNRVPKCGSSTMMDLITEMGRAHNFTFIRDGVFMTFYMQEPWKRQFAQRMFTFSTPMVYERHFHFIDFEDYNLSPRPVYINLVRDPLDRLVSWYYFRRFQEGHIRDMPTAKKYRTYDECVLGNHSECAYPGGDRAEEGYFKLIPFFCGQEAFCREPSEKSLSQAIHNIKQYYTVVGYIEEYHAFMQVLQYTLPSYFRGAPEVFKALSEAWKRNHRTTYKLPISEEVAQIMYGKLKHEYELYHFIQKRFNSIFNAIVSAEKKFRK